MAYETGSATNTADLMDKFVTFITTNAALVAGGEAWTLQRRDRYTGDTTRDRVELRGPGSGSDNIYVQIQARLDAATPQYCLQLTGSTNWSSSVAIANPELQAGSCAAGANLGQFFQSPTTNGAQTYHFIANGRRFIILSNGGGYWTSLYAGFFLPYATPSEYGYPLFLGGAVNTVGHTSFNYQTTGAPARAAFWRGLDESADDNPAGVLEPGGLWTRANAGTSAASSWKVKTWPWFTGPMDHYQRNGMQALQWLQPNNDGLRPVFPAVLFKADTTGGFYTLGELDGVYGIGGSGVAANDTITQGSNTYLVVPAGSNTDAGSYAAFLLA